MALQNLLYDTDSGQIVYGSSSSGNGFLPDASGALRTSQLTTTGQYTLYDLNGNNYFDFQENATATNTHNQANGRRIFTVTNNGDYVVAQTRQSHPYFAGNAQFITATYARFELETNVIKRFGYFSSAYTAPYVVGLDGIYFESNGQDNEYYLVIAKDGTETKIPRSSWDDPLDGTGISGMIWNPENFGVFSFDFLYLGGTGVSFRIQNGRNAVQFHVYNHANNFATTFVKTPQQPIRYEIRSNGNAGTFHMVCAEVGTGRDSQGLAGLKNSLPHQSSRISLSSTNTEYLLRAIRLRAGFEKAFLQFLDISATSESSDRVLITARYNATLPNLTWNAINNSVVEFANGNTGGSVINDGDILGSFYIENTDVNSASLASLRRLGVDLNGVRDTIAITATPLSANGLSRAVVSWTELG